MDTVNLKGTKLGKYEIQEELGRGGMGAVYKACDPMLDRQVAVKVLAPHLAWEKDFVERFLREARAAAQLKHPNIITIYDVGQQDNWYYFVMEYLEGQTLTQLIRRRGPMPMQETLHILRQLAEALNFAHERGLVHRDVKPGNAMINASGHVTLNDFGIVQAAQGARLTATGTMIGTLEYMSPEQMRGIRVDARSDQYSLGVMAYEMLTGRVPFKAESTAALIHKVVYDPPPPLRSGRADLPVQMEKVLERVLSKEPSARYADCKDFVSALEKASSARPLASLAKDYPATRTRLGGERKKTSGIPGWAWAVGAGGAAIVAMIVLVIGLLVALGSTRGNTLAAKPPDATPIAAVTKELQSTTTSEPVILPTATSAPVNTPIPVVVSTATPMPLPMATQPQPTATRPQPTATRLPETKRVTITNIQISGERYAVYFQTYNYQPTLPGEHIHFFFNTVPPEQAGMPGSGPWKLYPASAGASASSPFTGYSVAERPASATQLCALVANPNHSVQPNSGNCFDLP